VLIHGAPQPVLLSFDPHRHLVQVPHAPGPRLALAQLGGEPRAKLRHPAAYRLVRHPNPTLGEHLLYIPEAQGKTQIAPHGVGNHLARKAIWSSPPWWTRGLGCPRCEGEPRFVLGRAEVPQGGVPALGVVPALDVLADLPLGLGVRMPAAPLDQLPLQCGELSATEVYCTPRSECAPVPPTAAASRARAAAPASTKRRGKPSMGAACDAYRALFFPRYTGWHRMPTARLLHASERFWGRSLLLGEFGQSQVAAFWDARRRRFSGWIPADQITVSGGRPRRNQDCAPRSHSRTVLQRVVCHATRLRTVRSPSRHISSVHSDSGDRGLRRVCGVHAHRAADGTDARARTARISRVRVLRRHGRYTRRSVGVLARGKRSDARRSALRAHGVEREVASPLGRRKKMRG
jgi:hypothetical protein